MRYQHVIALILCLLIAAPSFAQPGGGAADAPAPSAAKGPRRHLATIVFAGLGGAVLGLSTLPFFGRPQDYLANIAIGFAVGVISGTVYVTYKALSEPDRFYGPVEGAGIMDQQRWGSDPRAIASHFGNTPQLGFTFNF
jgi:hypothetical protein